MGCINVISYLDLRRPLVFLCGPAYDENNPRDRRFILKRYINSKWKKGDDSQEDCVDAFPIIVDNFFKPDEIRNEGLNIRINIIEEIISNIAYRTYIFLDTMSTSYELGQFTNFAYNPNNVSVFVDSQYKERDNNAIGGYIKESFQNNFVEYKAEYDKERHISFPREKDAGPRIPKEIISVLERDSPVNIKESFFHSIVFSTNPKRINEPGTIAYKREKNNLTFDFSIKNLFYFVSASYRRIRESRTLDLISMPKSVADQLFRMFFDELNKDLLSSFVCCSKAKECRGFMLTPDFSVTIRVGNMNSEDLIYHMLYISFMINNYKGKRSYAVASYDYRRQPISLNFPNGEIDFLNIKNDHIKKLIKNCNVKTDDCGVICRKLRIKNKTRTIVTYESNHVGNELRYFHGEIANHLLSILPTSKFSFAYKEGLNTKMCLECHIGNTFFVKYDVNKYFESITMSSIKEKISTYIVTQFKTRFNRIVYYRDYKNRVAKDIQDMIRPLFYRYKLPIGYTTSPKLSDFYLFEMDEEMGRIDGVTYTRYADDILLSSNDKDALRAASEKLMSLLSREKLTINKKKTRFGSLNHIDDSFRFLGVNLVKRGNGEYELTISNRYIVETSKLFCSYVASRKDKYRLEEITGRINYIKSVSEKSFLRLKKIIKVKLNEAHLTVPYSISYLLEE